MMTTTLPPIHDSTLRPRPVLPSGWPWVSMLTGLMLAFCTLMLIVYGVASFGPAFALYNGLQTGMQVPATVTELEFIPNEDDEFNLWIVKYQFTVADGGQTLATQQVVREDTFKALAVGDSVPVAYPIGQPDEATLISEIRSPFSLWGGVAVFVGLGLLVGGVAVALIRRGAKGLAPAWALWRNGQTIEGQVLARWQAELDGETTTFLAWTFIPPGADQPITRAEPERRAWRKLQPGAPVRIRYQPSHPENNHLLV